jgi:integrase
VKKSKTPQIWDKTRTPNLVRYIRSRVYFARVRIGGKLIVRSLKTETFSVAQLRLSDFVKEERRKAASCEAVASGRMTFGDALDKLKSRVEADKGLKPRTKEYRKERIAALLRTWPKLESLDISKIRKSDCEKWAEAFGRASSPTAFNNTVGTLRMVLEIAVEAGARYDNPAAQIKKHKVRPKQLCLPSREQFAQMLQLIETNDGGYNHRCANLVRFLAYGGFRKSEAANIMWSDCDFEAGRIAVKGDPATGTKNGTIRYVHMIPEMYSLLKRLQNEISGEQNPGMVMKVKECQGAITTACRKLGIPRITHHDLRHLFATQCIEANVDIPTVSRWLGHKDGGALAMKTYGHFRDHHAKQMAEKVNFGSERDSKDCPV